MPENEQEFIDYKLAAEAVGIAIWNIDEIKSLMDSFEKTNRLLKAVNQVASLLLAASDDSDITDQVKVCLEIVGRTLDADRINIWKSVKLNDEIHVNCTYDWVSETKHKIKQLPELLSFSHPGLINLKEKFMRGEVINAAISDMAENNREFFGSFNIMSIVLIPIFYDNQLWGVFSVDICDRIHLFSADEIDIMQSVSLMITEAITRNALVEKRSHDLAIRTTAKLREAQEIADAANRAKSSFLASMSHEIRTPMNAIIGVVDIMMQRKNQSIETAEGLERIYSSCNLLLGIINDILDFSKIEAGKMDIEAGQYKVADLISETVQLYIMQMHGKLIEFEIRVDEAVRSSNRNRYRRDRSDQADRKR